MSLLVFLIVLSILVVVHEWGHYIAARSVGIRVEKFSVGFGPKLFSRMHDGTEFMICAIPLGGYVKLAGDERANCKGLQEEFFSHPVSHRAWVVVMGPMINFVFAYACFYIIFVTGFPLLAPRVGKVMENYPAYAAGLQADDKILTIDGKTMASWDEVQKYVTTSDGHSLALVIDRNGQQVNKTIIPLQKEIKNVFGQTERVRLIGIQPAEEIIFKRYGAGESVWKAGQEIVKITVMTFKALYHVFMGAMPAKDALAGPIRIFDVIKSAAEMGISYLLYIMGAISASLAIFNLFPIPVLDGGHLFLMAVEKLRGRPLSLRLEEGLTKVGLSLLLCLMFYVLYNDMVEVGWVDSMKNFVDKVKDAK